MSLVPLYEGQMLWRETVDRMAAQGFEPGVAGPRLLRPAQGRLLQADGVFAHRRAIETPT